MRLAKFSKSERDSPRVTMTISAVPANRSKRRHVWPTSGRPATSMNSLLACPIREPRPAATMTMDIPDMITDYAIRSCAT